MLAKKIITREKFLDFLHKTFINKNDIESLMSLFYLVRNVELLEKAMFVLYNEYISPDEILASISTTAGLTDDTVDLNVKITAVTKQLKTMIESTGVSFYEHNSVTNEFEDVTYKYMRQYFFRDYVTTLTFENYADMNNMLDQLDVIYDSLTVEEQTFLQKELNINRASFSRLVRTQTNNTTISRALAESFEPIFDLSGHCLGKLDHNTTILDIGDSYTYYDEEDEEDKTTTVKNGDFYIVDETGTYKNLYARKYTYLYVANNQYNVTQHLPIRKLSDILNNTNPSITTYDNAGYASLTPNTDYYLDGKNSDSIDLIVSKRDCFISILNKISQGTIH